MIPYSNIKIVNPNNFYDKYDLGEENVSFLLEMAEEGREQEAVDIFVEEFILPPGVDYQDVISNYLGESRSGVLKEQDKNSLLRNIAILTVGLTVLLQNNFSKFN